MEYMKSKLLAAMTGSEEKISLIFSSKLFLKKWQTILTSIQCEMIQLQCGESKMWPRNPNYYFQVLNLWKSECLLLKVTETNWKILFARFVVTNLKPNANPCWIASNELLEKFSKIQITIS